jgi:hypothetical protein
LSPDVVNNAQLEIDFSCSWSVWLRDERYHYQIRKSKRLTIYPGIS